jgi:hypothetical protein
MTKALALVALDLGPPMVGREKRKKSPSSPMVHGEGNVVVLTPALPSPAPLGAGWATSPWRRSGRPRSRMRRQRDAADVPHRGLGARQCGTMGRWWTAAAAAAMVGGRAAASEMSCCCDAMVKNYRVSGPRLFYSVICSGQFCEPRWAMIVGGIP